ncbi:MAG: hypothetical protein GY719_03785 [bacterium]|nr:hypothetical protein [bacterium]
MDQHRRNLVAQWIFDTRPILGRFHLWLEDVEEVWQKGEGGADGEHVSFVEAPLARAFIMAAAVTALGTRLFGRFGEGAGAGDLEVNRVKKHADAVSAYALSEALWYLTRSLPENHAVMVSLGEGLMPKAGESSDMGSNPLLGFGRVYGRPQVAKFLDQRIHRLINEPGYGWGDFTREVQEARITIWGAAIDALENTSRFARGKATGPMTLLHLYDQPLLVSTPYEGYFGNLVLPRAVVEHAERKSILLSYHTPRAVVMDVVLEAYPELSAERVHVWTLGGGSREQRLGALWAEWRALGAQVVEDGWRIPGGGEVFTDSGTYAPVSRVGLFEAEDGRPALFLCDGYSASAEAIQAASLDPIHDCRTSIRLFSSTFQLPVEHERDVMDLDAESVSFGEDLAAVAGSTVDPELVERYRESIRDARDADLPCDRLQLSIDDFFPSRTWRLLAVNGFMLPDPFSGCPGVEEVGEGTYRVTVRAATRGSLRDVAFVLRLSETFEKSRLVFSPLLDRFYAGQDYHTRAVKVSDSGRIRNELQTLCSDALEYFGENSFRVHFDQIGDAVMSPKKKQFIREVLTWYKEQHPIWFLWLEIAD